MPGMALNASSMNMGVLLLRRALSYHLPIHGLIAKTMLFRLTTILSF